MIEKRFSRIVWLCLLTLVLLPACSDSDEEALSEEEALEDLGAMVAEANTVLTLAFQGVPGKTARPTIDCPEGGQMEVEAAEGETGFVMSLELDDCNGIDGELDMAGTSSFKDQLFRYEFTLDGNLRERCEISYDGFGQRILTNLSTQQTSVFMNGTMGASCGVRTMTCSFDDVAMELQTPGADVFAQHCRF